MQPRDLLLLFLYLHIASAIIAFGPGFVMPIIGGMGGRNPAHANFAVRVSYAIASRLAFPVAVVVGLTGLGLIWASGRDLTRELWLVIAIALYLTALGLVFFVGLPTARRLIEATSGGPPPGGPAAMSPAAESAEGRPAGPPPHIAALVLRSQRVGLLMMVLVLTILALMVFKPTF